LTAHPSRMDFGPITLVSPDGSNRIPAHLWPELEVAVMLEPEPEMRADWVRTLQLGLRRACAAERRLREAPPWSILRVATPMARKVADALTDAGVRCYVPVEKYRPPNHWRARTRPLIPGYVFAELLDDDMLDLARENHAVREVMSRDGRAVTIPALAIGTLVAFEALHLFDRTWKPTWRSHKRRGRKASTIQSRWQHGQRVRVLDGSFAGFEGDITSVARPQRIEVLVYIFGRAVPVELGEDEVESLA
jgi:transcription antitermination factor NusG